MSQSTTMTSGQEQPKSTKSLQMNSRIVTSIIKHAEEARIQARTSTETFELLESTEEKCRFEDEGARQSFLDTMSQASKSAVFGFAHAKELDHEAKDYSTKALRFPASLRHVEQEEDGRKPNLFDSEFVKELQMRRGPLTVDTFANRHNRKLHNLAKNQVTDIEIDISGSHIDGLTEVQIKKLRKKKNAPAYGNNNINALSNRFKKIVNSGSLKVALNSCENYKPTTPVEHVVNRIYLFVLRTHVERPWVFSSENLKRYSEFDLQVKFWGYIFELYLGQHRHIILHWGDTMSDTCKNVGLRFKLDLRVLILRKDETVVDGASGEIARKATKAKLYADRLKSVLTTKCHLNAFLKSLRYISEEDIMNVQMPIVQVMGLEAKVSSLRLIAKKKYAMEDLHSFKFPQTSEQLKSGELQTLINGLTLIEIVIYSQVISPNTSTLILD
ncbi:hypothetical protein G6F26_007874 [Rhizopus arrhizus]|nr:hypothetical protein G6F17_006627 [Rhizopus arrhizus]KAG1423881.1 hypothetical protein G6F58_002643 [Rhizopus delemar]KAG0938643.1 hypothetical protein G6F30_007651 [Rhizopus arrhizus]KAG0992800.1 hypothetical protein G6F28_007296 [Rhizopus arrhizus]KAG1006710.1 hypothetical protein G6F27_008051 [Rhizopus arrhizus]